MNKLKILVACEFSGIVRDAFAAVESKLLAYFKCGKKAYLCGVEGKEVRPK